MTFTIRNRFSIKTNVKKAKSKLSRSIRSRSLESSIEPNATWIALHGIPSSTQGTAKQKETIDYLTKENKRLLAELHQAGDQIIELEQKLEESVSLKAKFAQWFFATGRLLYETSVEVIANSLVRMIADPTVFDREMAAIQVQTQSLKDYDLINMGNEDSPDRALILRQLYEQYFTQDLKGTVLHLADIGALRQRDDLMKLTTFFPALHDKIREIIRK